MKIQKLRGKKRREKDEKERKYDSSREGREKKTSGSLFGSVKTLRQINIKLLEGIKGKFKRRKGGEKRFSHDSSNIQPTLVLMHIQNKFTQCLAPYRIMHSYSDRHYCIFAVAFGMELK